MISNDFESLNYETYLKVRKLFQHSQPSTVQCTGAHYGASVCGQWLTNGRQATTRAPDELHICSRKITTSELKRFQLESEQCS